MSLEEFSQIYLNYKSEKSPENERDAVKALYGLARNTAKGIFYFYADKFRGNYFIDFEDLVQVSVMHGLSAIDRYDPQLGASITTFLINNMKHKIIDELTSHFPWLEKNNSHNGTAKRCFQFLSLDDLPEISTDRKRKTPQNVYELSEAVQWAMDSLSPRQKLILDYYFFEKMPLKDIGNTIGMKESGVSQIKKAGLERMKRKLTPVFR